MASEGSVYEVTDLRLRINRTGMPAADSEHVAGTARGKCLTEAREGSSRARESVVNMHVLILNTECCKTVTLCCEIPSGRRDAGISDEHPTTVAFIPPSPGIFAGQAYANPQARRYLTSADRDGSEKVSR